VRQSHAADDGRLHRVVFLTLLPLGLATAPGRTAGTAERAGRTAALPGTATAAAGAAARTAGPATAAGTPAEPSGTASGSSAYSAAAPIVTATTVRAGTTGPTWPGASGSWRAGTCRATYSGRAAGTGRHAAG
jgi:hypothetical protein